MRIGCDLCQISEMDRMLRGDGSMDRLFNESERIYAHHQARPAQHLAGIFAAKEALLKALPKPGLLGKYYHKVTVEHAQSGKPQFLFSEDLQHWFTEQGVRIHNVSISHDGDYAMATVMVGSADTQREGAQGSVRCYRCHLTLESLSKKGIVDVFMKVQDVSGQEKYLCPVCARGW